MELIELIYQSHANSDFSYSELNELMVLSKLNNQKKGITGCLVYHNRTFIQVLEGKKDDVEQLFKNIIYDDRHSNIEILWKSEIETRGFSGWSMSLMNLNNIKFAEIFSDYLESDNLDYDIYGIMTMSKAMLKEMKHSI